MLNKIWNSDISTILGYFWNRVFKDNGLLNLVKRIHATYGDVLDRYTNGILRSLKVTSVENSTYISTINVPVNACIHNAKPLSRYVFNGLVHQNSGYRSLWIPKIYVGDCVAIQDKVVDPDVVWINHINMDITSDFVVLWVKPDYVFMQEAITDDNGHVINSYKIYVATKRTFVGNTDNQGVICGSRLDDFDVDVKKAIWKSFVDAPTYKDLNIILSSAVGNTVCSRDSVVYKVWREMDHSCVLTSDGDIYIGTGNPVVTVGDQTKDGDSLFTGLYKFDKNTLPSPTFVPYVVTKVNGSSVCCTNTYSTPNVYNDRIVPSFVSNSIISSIPDNEYIPLLTSKDPINNLQYVLKNMYPGNGFIYTIDTSMLINDKSVYEACKIINRNLNIPDICSVISASNANNIKCTVKLSDATSTISPDVYNVGVMIGFKHSTATII